MTEDIKHGFYDYFSLDWFSQPYKNDVGIQSPPFQRIINQGRVDEIKDGLIRTIDKDIILQIGVISIAEHKGVRYIIDGQHRLAAYRQLGQPKVIMTQTWVVNSYDELKDIFMMINKNVPVESYVLDDNIVEKLAYDKLIVYVEKTYKNFIKSPTTTGRNNFPNINSQTFRAVLPYIKFLKNVGEDKIIDKFEEYNLICKSKLKKKDKDSAAAMEAVCKSKKTKPLYINRDIMSLWRENASKINS